jgi:ABC-type dipeptide/oligopeptide/nickel transport system permease component
MIRFIFRRLFFLILTAVLIVFFVHLGMRMAANSTSVAPNFDLGSQAAAAWSETRAYLRLVPTGSLGIVNQNGNLLSVRSLVLQSYVNSMGLLLSALAAAALLGGIVGALLALTRLRHLTTPVLTLTVLGISTPSFFAALLLQQGEIFFLNKTGFRLVRVVGFGWSFEYMLLPLLVLMARPLAYLTRTVYLNLRRVMGEDYIRTARSKGLSFAQIINAHVVRNAAVPVLTALGVSLRFSLGSLPIVEIFFGWPGLGQTLLAAVNARQTVLAVTLALALGLTILGTNLLLDIIYRLLDPRLRVEHEASG